MTKQQYIRNNDAFFSGRESTTNEEIICNDGETIPAGSRIKIKYKSGAGGFNIIDTKTGLHFSQVKYQKIEFEF
jgi:hypothetical protein